VLPTIGQPLSPRILSSEFARFVQIISRLTFVTWNIFSLKSQRLRLVRSSTTTLQFLAQTLDPVLIFPLLVSRPPRAHLRDYPAPRFIVIFPHDGALGAFSRAINGSRPSFFIANPARKKAICCLPFVSSDSFTDDQLPCCGKMPLFLSLSLSLSLCLYLSFFPSCPEK